MTDDNTQKAPQVAVPSSTPTLGAIVGGILSNAVAMKVGADPVTQAAASTVVTSLFAWLFHFAHAKLGTPE